MPRSKAPEWKRRRDPIVDDLIWASVNQSNGVYDPETGHYATLIYQGCPTYDRAKEISDALFRCSFYMHKHKILSVSMNTNIVKQPDGTYNVEYRAINKAHARAYIVATKGTDRSKWAYDPRAKTPTN